MIPQLSSETIHASCVAIHGRALLIGGASGRGKSDLALRLIDRGAALVADDYTLLRRTRAGLLASAPQTIRGRIEVRGLGIVDWPAIEDIPVALHLDLDAEALRLPDRVATRLFAGIAIPTLPFEGLTPAAPIKAEIALRLHGLPLP